MRTYVVAAVAMAGFLLAGCGPKPAPQPGPSDAGTTPPPRLQPVDSADIHTPLPSPTPRSYPMPTPTPAAVAGATRSYTIQAHDTLSTIAEKELGDKHRWKEIAALNPQLPDPNKLKIGDVIKLPAK